MTRGYCPNQECPNIDFLDEARPCPTCGREVRELSPREYWRARTIKMMHAHEIAEIAEIQEVARRALGEASVVPKALRPEEAAPRPEHQGADEIDSAEVTERMISSEETTSGEPELVATELEIEGVDEVEELPTPLTAVAISEGENVENELEASRAPEATILDSGLESITEEGGEPEESDERLDRGLLVSEQGTGGGDESGIIGTLKSTLESEESENESTPGDVEEGGVSVLREVSEVEEVPFVEGVVGIGAGLESMEEESAQNRLREGETVSSSEASEAKEIAELEERSELLGETGDTELAEWERSEALRRESAEEVSAPVELPVGGGVERPASPVRIITFREGGTEIGICPYCGRFVRGSDLARHKLKHRVRNVLGFQREE